MTKTAAVPLMTRFGLARYRPAGAWTVATPPEPVVGSGYRADDLRAFCDAVRRAERYGLRYGVELRREPGGVAGSEAINVFGTVESRAPLGGRRRQEWAIGVLSRGLTWHAIDRFLSRGLDVEGELISIVEHPGGAPVVSLSLLCPAPTATAAHSRAPRLSVVR